MNKSGEDTQANVTKPLLLEAGSNNDPNTVDGRLTPLAVTDAKSPKFLVHKNIICHYSPYFSAAFNGNFVEGRTKTINLDVDEKAFGILVNWLYTQDIFSENGDQPSLAPLARLWIMAEEFLMPEFQDQAMREIYNGVKESGVKSFYQDFGHFTEIACQHGTGDNPLVDIGLWTLGWCQFDFVSRHMDRIPGAMVKQALLYFKEKGAAERDKDFYERKVSAFYVSKDT